MKLKSGKLTYPEDGSPVLVVQGVNKKGMSLVTAVELDNIGTKKDRVGFNNTMEAALQKLIDEHGE